MNSPTRQPTSRRHFLKTSTAAAAGVFAAQFVVREKAFAANSDTLRVGLIGCGGRGTGAALQALSADNNAILVAMGDAFQDRLEQSLSNLKGQEDVASRVLVEPERRFVGLDAYQKVIDSGVDVVLLTSPPGFRPAHFEAAVAAGKHIFAEKPIATDGPGYRLFMEAAEESRRKKLAVVAGFCWRYNHAERAAFQRMHEGQIGDIQTIYGAYFAGPVWSRPRQPGWTDFEWQMRNWYYFTWLSGDHLVEQAVHSVDKMAWAKQDVMPAKAIATGGRQVRTGPEFGHIYDHFAVVYEWADRSKGFLFCRQQEGCANDNSDMIWGTKGICRVPGFAGVPFFTGENKWRYTGERPSMFQVEHDELFASIRAGQPINDSVWLANSSMMAIMGRMAAYTGREITWEQAIDSKENLAPEKLDWNQPLDVPPVAMPGKTAFL